MKKLLTLLVFVLFMTGFANGQVRRYVTQSGAGLKDGTDWLNAYDNTQLQTAINETGIAEVWVAAGTYYPTTGTDRTISFNMKNDVAIYGGFAGTETLLSERNWNTNVAILSGDIGTIGDNSDNSEHVIYNSGLNNTAILDGFTIKDGNASTNGGGIFNGSSTPIFANLVISGNNAVYGGGIGNSSSSPSLTNCTIVNNTSSYGGAMYNISSSSPILINCLIFNNSASGNGGGVYNYSNSSPNFTNCTITGNFTPINGGGIFNTDSSSPTLNNSIVWGNIANGSGKQFYIADGTTTLNYSCYGNNIGDFYNTGTFTPDEHCITTDPKFVNPNNDLRIAGNSPCADSGNDALNGETNDIRGAGFGRKLSKTDAGTAGTIDMGAYEFKKGTDPETPELLRFYVKSDASGSENGSSWANAYTSLKNAITAAGRYYEIWVAAGTYYPTTGTDRDICFNMKNDVAIYGGFAGTETLLTQRDWKTNATILSGDIGTTGDNSDNSEHVIYNSGLNNTAILDGFTIKDGNASTNGGGIFNGSSTPVFANLVISGNYAVYGGGIGNSSSSPSLTNCTIVNNSSSYGGAMYNISSSSPILINCLIFNNSASGNGGGVYNYSNSSPNFTNCTITGNFTPINGGGIFNTDSSSPTLNNSIVWGNIANGSGKQFYIADGTTTLNYSCYGNNIGDFYNTGTFTPDEHCITTDPKFINPNSDFRIAGNSPCVDASNEASNSEATDIRGLGFGRKLLKTDAGSAGNIDMGAYEFKKGTDPDVPEVLRIYVKSSATGSNNGTSWANAFTSLQNAITAAGKYYEIWVATGTYKPTTGTDRAISFNMKDGVAIYGGFAGTETSLSERNWTANETILSGDIGTSGVNTDNSYHVVYSTGLIYTAILDGFTIQDGHSDTDGGGVYNLISSPTISNCKISGNIADRMGGGVYNQRSSATIVNCIISGNTTSDAFYGGGGVMNMNFGYPQLTNCTISGNSSVGYGGGVSNYGCVPTLTNCLIINNTSNSSTGGVFNSDSASPTITNCTISSNSKEGVYSFNGGSIAFNNSIIWGNGGNEIVTGNDITATLNYSCYDARDVNFAGSFTPTNCITTNPKFVNPNSDFRIAGNSPCADTGNDAANSETTDIRGTGFGRKLLKTDSGTAGTIDMGAYEFKKGTDPDEPDVLWIYVNASATGANNGTSWGNAFTSLTAGITAAVKYYEVWVAAGTYYPTDGTDRSISFNMKNDVVIYGGFAGTESALSQRKISTNVTILSGDIGTTGDNADNSYHVVYTTGMNNTAILDGFAIHGGYADTGGDYGGGIYNESSSPTLVNLTIYENYAWGGGSAIMNNSSSSPIMNNCLIYGNSSYAYAGAIFNASSSSPTMTNCTITGNSCSGGVGGGMNNYASSSPTVNNSIIWGNSAAGGYQIYNDRGSITLNYSCYSNGAGDIGGNPETANNCINSDPKFVYATGSDYRLQGTSPCKDAGSNTYVEAPNPVITTDVRGETRVQNTTVDMGAYEWTSGIDPEQTISWTGTVGIDWFTDGNWSSNLKPTASVFAIIPNTTNKPVINDAVNTAVCNGIAIANEAGAKLTIGTDGKLTITDKLTNYLTDVAGLLIKSEDTDLDPLTRTDRKTGSLKILGSVSGKATVEQWVAPDESHLISSPTANQPIVDFMIENTDIATSTATAPFTFAMRDYNITGTAWTDYFTDSKPSTDLFGTGKGYVVLTKSPVIVPLVFKGDLNSLPVNKVAIKTGWNLIGNPFTSAININSPASSASGGTNFIDANPDALTGSFAAVYVWDPTAIPKQYLVVNHTYNSSAPFYAQVGQGFFIKSAVSGNLNFASSLQVHQGTAPFKAATNPTPEIKLIASSSAGSVATLIKFIEGTTAGLDVGYDAGVFKADPSFSLYTRLVEDNGVDFQLQCLPTNQYGSLVIPVGIDSKAGGEIVFSVKTVQLDNNCKAILEDKLTNTFTDLSKGNYKAVVAANTSVSNRFYLHTGDVISGVGEQTLSETKLTAYAVRNVEIRVVGEVGNDAIATLYNGLGKVVLVKKLGAGNLNIIGLPNLTSGIYLLNINDKATSQTIKVMIRK